MKRDNLLFITIGVLIGFTFSFWFNYVESIPPTPAFDTIIVDGQVIGADKYNSILIIETDNATDILQVEKNKIFLTLQQERCAQDEAIVGVDNQSGFICANPSDSQ